MSPIVINTTTLRTHTREIMQRVKFKSEAFLVKNFDQPMAVIISVEEYEQLTSAAGRELKPGTSPTPSPAVRQS